MKNTFRKIFRPILNVFESGDGEFRYESSHRKILLAVGVLFLILSGVSGASALSSQQLGGLVPFIAFLVIGLVCEIVGLLGNDRAVSKIWGSK